PDLTGPHVATLTPRPIFLEHLRIGDLELRGEAGPHYAHAVHWIDQSLRVGDEDVTSDLTNHDGFLSSLSPYHFPSPPVALTSHSRARSRRSVALFSP